MTAGPAFDSAPDSASGRAQHALEEIWVSFASLLRAYLAAAELGAEGPHSEVQSSGSRLLVTRGNRQFVMRQNASQETHPGSGLWSLSDGRGILEQGAFSLDDHSRILWAGQPQELDAAAERITDLFLSTAHIPPPPSSGQAENRKQA